MDEKLYYRYALPDKDIFVELPFSDNEIGIILHIDKELNKDDLYYDNMKNIFLEEHVLERKENALVMSFSDFITKYKDIIEEKKIKTKYYKYISQELNNRQIIVKADTQKEIEIMESFYEMIKKDNPQVLAKETSLEDVGISNILMAASFKEFRNMLNEKEKNVIAKIENEDVKNVKGAIKMTMEELKVAVGEQRKEDKRFPEQDNEKMELIFDILKKVSRDKKIFICEEHIEKDGEYACFSNTSHSIIIDERLSLPEKCSVALSEMAKADTYYQRRDISASMREECGKSIAYMVAQNFGIEVSKPSFNHTAQSGTDIIKLKSSLDFIISQSKKMTSEITKELKARGYSMSFVSLKENTDDKKNIKDNKEYIR